MKILVPIGIVLAVWFAAAAFMPKHFEYERSISINASREMVFSQMSDLKNWPKWDPWNDLDTSLKVTYGKNAAGQDTCAWKSTNKQVGNGGVTVVESTPPSAFRSKLFFEGQGAADTWFELENAEAGATNVKWGMSVDVSWPFNAFMLFSKGNLERTVTETFDRGLAKLKKVAEGSPAPAAAAGLQVRSEAYAGASFLGIRQQLGFKDLTAKLFADGYGQIQAVMEKAKIETAGQPVGIYYTWDVDAQKTDMAVALPVKKGTAVNGGGITAFELPPGKALVVDYYGGYSGFGKAHEALLAYIKTNKLVEVPPVIEEYVTDPATEPDSNKWLSRIYYFVK